MHDPLIAHDSPQALHGLADVLLEALGAVHSSVDASTATVEAERASEAATRPAGGLSDGV